MNFVGAIEIPKDFKRGEQIRILLVGGKPQLEKHLEKHPIDTYHTIVMIGSPVNVRNILITFANKPLSFDDALAVLSRTRVEVTADGVKVLDVPLKRIPSAPRKQNVINGGWINGHWENSIHTGCEHDYLDTVVNNEMEISIRAMNTLWLSKVCEMCYSIDIEYTEVEEDEGPFRTTISGFGKAHKRAER